MARFVGADPSTSTVIFGKNTTEAINKLAYRYPLARRSVVLSTVMEHHSNDLPWRGRATVVRARVTRDGRLDEDDFDRLLDAYGESRRARSPSAGPRTSPASSSRSIGWRARRMRSARESWSTPRSWRPPPDRRQAGRPIPSISTSSRSPPTRCTRRSAPAR